jgi:hypothetical protein
MSTFLHRIAPDLAITAIVIPLASYGLHRMFPAPHAGFLVVANTVIICAATVIRAWSLEYAQKLTKVYGYVAKENITTNYRLNFIFSITIGMLLPIFARTVGQRMGFQVPGYLQTVGYYSLASNAFWISKTTYEILIN